MLRPRSDKDGVNNDEDLIKTQIIICHTKNKMPEQGIAEDIDIRLTDEFNIFTGVNH